MIQPSILFEDNHLLVIEKPSGIAVMGGKGIKINLLDQLKEWLARTYKKPGNVFLGLVHRLDTNVSGVMVFAKTSKAASRLSDQIRRRVWKKTYRCVVQGLLSETMEMVDYLHKDPINNRVEIVKTDKTGAKKAVLTANPIAHLSHDSDSLTLVEIDLETGRPHQIRVQLSSRGWPIVGDVKYGGKAAQHQKLALHAYRLQIEHPTLKQTLEFISEPNFTVFGFAD